MDQTGGFQVDDLPSGDYEIRLTNQYGGVLAKKYVSLREQTTHVSFEIRGTTPAAPAAGAVSVERLRHRIPSRALKEWRKAQAAIQQAHLAEAIGNLEKAVAADREYTDAYINLAACHATLHQFDRALGYARQAAALDPASVHARVNLSPILIYLRDHPAAETAAREAARLDPSSPMAHYLLGIALNGEGRDEETLANSDLAKPGVPLARLQAAELFVRRGRTRQAAGELRAYLDFRPRTRPRGGGELAVSPQTVVIRTLPANVGA